MIDNHLTGNHGQLLVSAGTGPPLLARPIQSVTFEQASTTAIELVFVVVLAAVGSLLTYQAFRGYRRNEDRSLALFGIGLCLLTVVHAGLKLTLEFVVPFVIPVDSTIGLGVAATSQIVDIAALVVIFYAIRE